MKRTGLLIAVMLATAGGDELPGQRHSPAQWFSNFGDNSLGRITTP